MEDLLDLGYDYDTAGKLAMDEDAYREAMDKGPIDDYAMGGKVHIYVDDYITHVGEYSYCSRFRDDLYQGSRPVKPIDDSKKIK